MLFSMRSFLLTAAFCFACVGVACARPTDRPSDVPALSRRGVEVKERLPLKNEIIKVLESRSGFFNGDAELAKVESGQKPAPHAARITFSDLARQELDRMGLHGKDRRKTVKWHKKHVKKEMKKIGASSAMVEHTAHKGGSNPKDPNHITASFKNRDGRAIKNNFNDGPNHHIYIHSKGMNQAGKAGKAQNDAKIKEASGMANAKKQTKLPFGAQPGVKKQGADANPKDYSKLHWKASLSKRPTAGKSGGKGKGKNKPEAGFPKNGQKGFQRKKK